MDALTLALAGFANVTAIIRMEFEVMTADQKKVIVDARVEFIKQCFDMVQDAKTHVASLNATIAQKVHDAIHGTSDPAPAAGQN